MKQLSRAFTALFVIGVFAACQAPPAQPPQPPAERPQPPASAPAAPDGAELILGQQIANSGAPNGVAACASCHGAQGEGIAASNFPRIAGQPKNYLAKQLMTYASGSRNNPIMTPIAKTLTPQQIGAVSAYYATLAPASAAGTAAEKTASQVMQRGQVLAHVGDETIGVQACVNCHGPGGTGEPPNYPYLAAQVEVYLSAQLKEWKSGARQTDPSLQMQTIAKRLSDNDIAAVAAYFAAQSAPPAAARRVNVPAAPPAAGRGGAVAEPTPRQGVSGGATGAPPGATEKSRP
ncbi:MAG: c-type cytochrome [Pseudomonadota bacterium]